MCVTDVLSHSCFIGNTIVFFGAFLGPIFAIILFNCVIFVMIVSVLFRHQFCLTMRYSEKMATKTAITFLIRVFGVMSLLGLTWLFGAFTVTGATLVFQVLFAIFNSLQGFFIFLFFCAVNRDARELWKETLSCGHYKSKSAYTTCKSGGTGTTPRHNQGTLSINVDSILRHIESTDTIHLSYQGESSTLKSLSAATNQETILGTNQTFFTNPVISPVAEEDSESLPTDPVTPDSEDDSVQYSPRATHERDEYEIDSESRPTDPVTPDSEGNSVQYSPRATHERDEYEIDSESRPTDPVTPDSEGDSVQYSRGATHNGDEYDSYKIDFS